LNTQSNWWLAWGAKRGWSSPTPAATRVTPTSGGCASYADLLGAPVLFVGDMIGDERGRAANGRKIYSLADIYPHADFVTYPSLIEGFGNAFLEAIYFRKPLLVQRYDVYAADIGPKGFQVVEFDEYITDETVTAVNHLLDNPAQVAQMAEHNYHIALQHYSYQTLQRLLQELVYKFMSA
jgi:mannosylglucosylglycerate synthase